VSSRIYFETKYLKNELAPIFKPAFLLNDILAGIVVALVAIPLSLAVAIASSVPPEIGLISAIIGGIIAAIFGGSTLAITGPAVGMTVIIAQTIQQYGYSGLLIMGLICGLLQIACGIFQLGRYTKLIPEPVVSAFIAALGIIIFVGQLPRALQLDRISGYNVFTTLKDISLVWREIPGNVFYLILLTMALVFILPKLMNKAFGVLLALVIPTAVVYFIQIHHIGFVKAIPHSLPYPGMPDFSHISNWGDIFVSGCIIFTIASLESLLSANALDKIVKTRLPHKLNQELIGQGLANVFVAIFGGIPVTGVIARSTVNISAGAKTRRSAIIHVLTIVIVIFYTPHVIENIPIPVLAGILLAAGLSMIRISDISKYWYSDKLDLVIYIVTLITILSSDLISGIRLGVLLVVVITVIKLLATKSNIQLSTNKSVVRIGLSGNLSFWSFDILGDIQEKVLDNDLIKFVIFEFQDVQKIDSNGARNLIELSQEITSHQIAVILHGVSDDGKKILNSVSDNQTKIIYTITENDIKLLLQQNGIEYQTTDVIKHGISKFSTRFAQENKQLINTLAQGQNPHTLLITCSDSRLDPNAFFSSNLGELFIVRNVGNVVPKFSTSHYHSEIAAIEFAIGALNIRNIVLCGHTECGAIKASIANFNNNSHSGLDNWLQFIKNGFGQIIPENANEGAKINLINQINNLQTYPLIKNLLNSNELTITALIYDVHSATMLEWDDKLQQLVPIIN
jgi:carbonic anhydrase